MPNNVSLDPALTVNEIIRRFPAALAPLHARGIDMCCRGDDTLAAAAEAIGIDPLAIVADIEAASNDGRPLPPQSCGYSGHASRKV